MGVKGKSKIWIFWVELMLATFIPFIVWWRTTPTNILNSNFLFKLLETIGLYTSTIIFFAGVPVGIIGIILSRKMDKFRTATITFSIVNLVAATIDIVILALIFCRAIFGGISV